MIKFFHYPICPISRQVRVYLKELNLEADIIKESYWERRVEFVKLNPASTVPIIIFDKEAIIGYYAITEFFKYFVLEYDQIFSLPNMPSFTSNKSILERA